MILRVCVCIPTYDNPATIAQVVKDALEQTPHPILVVDDGSQVPVERIVEPHARVRILRLEKNQGKGAALRAAFDDCIARGFTHALSLDGDGQHWASQARRLIALAAAHPWDLIIGNRKFASAHVPLVSKFGRRFSNFWVDFETGTNVSDSQSGLRVYPLFHVQTLRFWTSRYDFEIEVLIRLLWKGVAVRETEIEVFYPKPEQRVSHFRKFGDNARISLLNVALVGLSMLKSRRSPIKASLSIGIGILVGTTPFYGLHTLIVAGIALVLRLDFVALWLGSQISIPPLAPLLAAGSITVGRMITPHSSEAAHWLAGSLVMGTALGITASLLTYAGLSRFNSSANAQWNGKTRGGKVGNGFLKLVSKYVGIKAAYACLYFIVPYFYFFAPKARKAAHEYWRVVKPKAGALARRWLVCRQMFRFGQTLLDRVYQGFHAEPRFTTIADGLENILHPMRENRGLILLTAHVGGWDLAARLLAPNGLTGAFHTVEYQARSKNFSSVRGHDLETIRLVRSNDATMPPALVVRELLERGEPVGIMGDRPVGSQYELLPFFGRLAPFDVTAFRIAAACRAPLLFTYGFKATGDAYELQALPARFYVYDPNRDRSLQCADWARDYARALEHALETRLEQWFNFFPLWSTRPARPPGVVSSKERGFLVEELEARLSPQPPRTTHDHGDVHQQ